MNSWKAHKHKLVRYAIAQRDLNDPQRRYQQGEAGRGFWNNVLAQEDRQDSNHAYACTRAGIRFSHPSTLLAYMFIGGIYGSIVGAACASIFLGNGDYGLMTKVACKTGTGLAGLMVGGAVGSGLGLFCSIKSIVDWGVIDSVSAELCKKKEEREARKERTFNARRN